MQSSVTFSELFHLNLALTSINISYLLESTSLQMLKFLLLK